MNVLTDQYHIKTRSRILETVLLMRARIGTRTHIQGVKQKKIIFPLGASHFKMNEKKKENQLTTIAVAVHRTFYDCFSNGISKPPRKIM